MPYTLKTPVHSEMLIRKSRFIACVPYALEGFIRRVNDAGLGQILWLATPS